MSINNNSVCKITHLYKKYDTKILFSDFSLDIFKGDRVGIIGKNGAGKTTLLNMIIGKTPQDKGTIVFNNKFINDKLLDIGYISQQFRFPTFFKVKDIYKLILDDLKLNNRYIKYYFDEITSVLDIETLLNKKYSKLSAGEKQKVNLFSILSYNSKLLLLDEFTSNIDIETNQKIRKFLNNNSITMLVVSHNVRDIVEICNKVLFIADGKIQKILLNHEINESSIKTLFNERR